MGWAEEVHDLFICVDPRHFVPVEYSCSIPFLSLALCMSVLPRSALKSSFILGHFSRGAFN